MLCSLSISSYTHLSHTVLRCSQLYNDNCSHLPCQHKYHYSDMVEKYIRQFLIGKIKYNTQYFVFPSVSNANYKSKYIMQKFQSSLWEPCVIKVARFVA